MLAKRGRWLIVAGSVVTVLVALVGMQSMWGAAEWVEVSSWGAADWGYGRNAFWYEYALALGVAAAIALAWLPRFAVDRLLRVAMLLPVIHVVAIAVAACAWSVLQGDIQHTTAVLGWGRSNMPEVTAPSAILVMIAFGTIVAVAIVIKRRHGEWAHAATMMALAYVLLLGLWLPVLARLSVSSPGPLDAVEHAVAYGPQDFYYWGWLVNRRLLSSETFAALAVIPPAVIGIAFTALVFRWPQRFARSRGKLQLATKLLLGGAVLSALTLPDEGWLLYLESSYLVLFAVLLAIAALVTLAIITWLGSCAAERRLRGMTTLEGVVADDDDGEVARFEITSWLRGPRLAVRSFVVTTPRGSVPLTGITVLAQPSATTASLDVGGHVRVLAPGDRVVLGGRRGSDDGHPFRAIDATDVAIVATPDVRRYRFSDIALVVWRPAAAYLAILVAIALPYLSIFLT